jgi:plastocyanin
MNPRFSSPLCALLTGLVVSLSMPAHAGDHPVAQANKAFTVAALKAKVGDTVTFRNDDTFAHNVFSLSDTQNFDLGSYKKGETRQVKLTTPGVIEVECAIHPQMKMKIEVEK